MYLNIEDKKTHKAWLQNLKIGDAVEVIFLRSGTRGGPEYCPGTVTKISPTGRPQVQLKKKRGLRDVYSFMPDGKRVGGGYGCALFMPSMRINAERERKRLRNLIRAQIKRVRKYGKTIPPLEVVTNDELALFAAALQLVLHVVDYEYEKPEPSELVCPCGTCRGLENP